MRCAVVGGDQLAETWAEHLARQGAMTQLFHPRPSDAFLKSAPQFGKLSVSPRDFEEADFKECDWMIVTTEDRAACERLSRWAKSHHVWCALLHFPELGSLAIPQAVSFDTFQMLLPFGPANPRIHDRLSNALQKFLPADFSRAVELLQSVEKQVNAQTGDRRQRARILDALLGSHFPELIANSRWESAQELANKVLQSFSGDPSRRQRVSPRVGVQLNVSFFGDGRTQTGKIFNLSRDGVFIATKNILPKLTHVTAIEFILPNGQHVRDAEGFVVWENLPLQPRAPMYPPGFALMFDSLSTENLSGIEEFVRSQLR